MLIYEPMDSEDGPVDKGSGTGAGVACEKCGKQSDISIVAGEHSTQEMENGGRSNVWAFRLWCTYCQHATALIIRSHQRGVFIQADEWHDEPRKTQTAAIAV